MRYRLNAPAATPLVHKCPCGHVNVLGFPVQLKWQIVGNAATHLGFCAACNALFEVKRPVERYSVCGTESCPGRDVCKSCYEEIAAERCEDLDSLKGVSVDPSLVEANMVFKLHECLRNVIGETEELTTDMELSEDLGLDSLDLAELAFEIEDEFDLPSQSVTCGPNTTIAELLAAIRAAQSSK